MFSRVGAARAINTKGGERIRTRSEAVREVSECRGRLSQAEFFQTRRMMSWPLKNYLYKVSYYDTLYSIHYPLLLTIGARFEPATALN